MLCASCFSSGSHAEFLSGSGSAACNGCEVIYSLGGRERERTLRLGLVPSSPRGNSSAELTTNRPVCMGLEGCFVDGSSLRTLSYRYDSHTSAE
ncbi:hypothetical protein LX32DRAFT_242547 [Colletotrichum zoysiae]|uniref:GATA-type domain-containing protein n=1 Tax=Colletotrichum zoysiae TaxID=1216348 RepID=A0AAD9H355_9PEZI|nr:hypothetical protein LX32DRAFT_242547 [Colletotrichum zoysiae]